MAEAWRNLPPFNGIYSVDPNKKEATNETSDVEDAQEEEEEDDDAHESPSVTSTAAAF